MLPIAQYNNKAKVLYFLLSPAFFLLFFLALFANIKVSAQDASPAPEASPLATPAATDQQTTVSTAGIYKDYAQFDHFLGFAENWTPASPFYFVKRAEETVRLTFTFNPLQKQEIRMAIAGERLAEIETMTEEGASPTAISSAITSYQNEVAAISTGLENLAGQGQDVSGTTAAVDFETSRHGLVLEEVALEVPQEAENAIQTAIVASERAVDTVADIAGRPAIPDELIQRVKALEEEGILTSEEAAALLASDSRRDARSILRNYREERILPEADYAKLNETARYYFPDGYVTTLEIRRFIELSELENQSPPDQATIERVRQFTTTYSPGEPVPTDLRRWWIPFVRLEELQNTIRPYVIPPGLFDRRPEYKTHFETVANRVKPTKEDMELVSSLVSANPAILNDPVYERIMALGQRFGIADVEFRSRITYNSCGPNSHWVYAPFMPEGGNCVPNYEYRGPVYSDTPATACPSGYHRSHSSSPCYPDGPGKGLSDYVPAAQSCSPGYHWVPEPSTRSGGYCSPDYSARDGYYTGRWYPPTYCSGNNVFRDGECKPYNPPPAEGCQQGSWWNGEKCVVPKDCGARQYQDSNGECRSTQSEYDRYRSQCGGSAMPTGGCGAGYWDMASCSCKYTPTPGTGTGGCPPGYRGVVYGDAIDCVKDNVLGSCSPPAGGCGQGGYWDPGYCSCKYTDTTVPPTCTAPPGGCGGAGRGGYWNPVSCNCNDPVYTACTPTAGGGAGGWWDTASCSYVYGRVTSYCTTPRTACSSDQYWDDGSCSCKPMSSRPQYTPTGTSGTCTPPAGGCTGDSWWDGRDCYCRRPGDPVSYSTTSYTGYATPYGDPSTCSAPPAGCGGSNWYWDQGTCSCRSVNDPYRNTYNTGSSTYGSQGCTPPSSGCESNKYWDWGACSCVPSTSTGSYTYSGTYSGSYRTSCSPPSSGCGSEAYWDYGGCYCRSNSSPYISSPSGSYGGCQQPPGGCGSYTWDTGTCTCKPSCPSGTTWNGASCMTNSPTTGTYTGSYGTGCLPPSAGCGSSSYWDYGLCTCRSNTSTNYGTSGGCANVSASSCPSGSYFDWGACTCRSSSTTSTSGSCGPGYYWTGSYCALTTGGTSGSTSTTTPVPTTSTGTTTSTGSCPAGSHWMSDNGGYCMSDSTTSSSPAPTSTESSPAPAPDTTSTTTTTTTEPSPAPVQGASTQRSLLQRLLDFLRGR